MTNDQIQRYQPGGDIYARLEAERGRTGACLVAQAALTGDRTAITEALAQLNSGDPRDDSTARLFWSQVTTDPFDAPLESLNSGLGVFGRSAIVGVLRNPWVLLALAAVVFYAIGGPRWLFEKARLK
jgi:hypothetical protein